MQLEENLEWCKALIRSNKDEALGIIHDGSVKSSELKCVGI